MNTIGYAIVGTGYFGAELGRIMKEQEGAKIVAVLDPENGTTIAAELGCDVETDLDVLCSRQDVDAVIVATPIICTRSRCLPQRVTRRMFSAKSPLLLATMIAAIW